MATQKLIIKKVSYDEYNAIQNNIIDISIKKINETGNSVIKTIESVLEELNISATEQELRDLYDTVQMRMGDQTWKENMESFVENWDSEPETESN